MSLVPAVEATTGTGYVSPVRAIDDLDPLGGSAPADGVSASAFAQALGGAVDGTQALQATSNELAIAAVTGDLADVHDASIAATRAQTTLETVAAVRNKAIDAFNSIMNMQA